MLQRAMHVFSSFVLVVLFGVQGAGAVSFERIDVASHIGEPFYAEVPLRLGKRESLSKISIELGASSDYRILEVYRDQVIDKIRVDIVKDARGLRVKLSSEAPVDTAFFNLVLKVRHGRSTHYKKMPIFLEAASISVLQANEQPVIAAPVSAANVKPDTSDAFVTKAPKGANAAFKEPTKENGPAEAAQNNFKAFADWARTSRYGPMVYGDTITTVAKRLRLDKRFTNQQVMVALFEKNKGKFGKGNINLIKAGSYLDVPKAGEVSAISAAQAKRVISEQSKAWKNMVKQPKYAAVADAQRTRYTRRVRIGQQASGVVNSPIVAPESTKKHNRPEVVTQMKEKTKAVNEHQAELLSVKDALAQKDHALSAMQEKMAGLEKRLMQAENKANSAIMSVDAAALDSQNKRLEIVISRLKNQLDQAKKGEEQGAADWMMYAIAGFGLLILALIGAVVMLLRRSPSQLDQREETENTFDDAVMDDDAITTEASDSLDDADAGINVDDFAMPEEASADGEMDSLDDMFDEGDLEDIPDFTDDETGEMEAFDADDQETPDPSVNYLEEADVYMRYGMEEEAEKQVKMALKLDAEDPAAHAKLVAVIRAKGDSSAETKAITAAKTVLTGAVLATFEGLLSSVSESDTGEISDVSSLKDDDFTGDDTGIVDFGEINFDTKEAESDKVEPSETSSDVMEPELLDTGKMDFGEVVNESQDVDLNAGGDDDFTGINFDEPDSIDATDSIDFGDINLGDEVGNVNEDVMDAIGLDTGELDFGALQVDDASTDVSEDVMEIASLDSGEVDFGDIPVPVLESSSKEDGVMESVSLDTGEVDFGEMALESPSTAEEEPAGDVMAAELLDTGEIDFGDLSSEGSGSTNASEKHEAAEKSDGIVDFDFSEMGLNENDTADATKNGVDDNLEESLNLGEFGIDFNALDTLDAKDVMPTENEVVEEIDLESFEIGHDDAEEVLSELEMNTTAEVAVADETMVVSENTPSVNLENAMNDREVDRAIAEADAEAKAVSVEVPHDDEDPFATANTLLKEADEDSLSIDLADDDFGVLQGEDEDLFALDEANPTQAEDEVIALVEIEDDTENESELTALDDLDSVSADLSDLDQGLSSALDDVKSIEDTLIPDIGDDFEGLATIGDDLMINNTDDDSAGVLDDLTLDEFDIGDFDVSDLDAAVDVPTTATSVDNNFDATVVLKKTPEVTMDHASLDKLDELADMIGDKTLVMDSSDNPMDDPYSATGELKIIEESIDSDQEDPMSSFEATTELDGLMDDLKGLLDEDEPKK